jgi:hypothetical protein
LILFFTIIQASLGSFILFLTMVDCIGPSAPTYLVDRFLLRKEVPVSEESERTEKVVAGDESTRH